MPPALGAQSLNHWTPREEPLPPSRCITLGLESHSSIKWGISMPLMGCKGDVCSGKIWKVYNGAWTRQGSLLFAEQVPTGVQRPKSVFPEPCCARQWSQGRAQCFLSHCQPCWCAEDSALISTSRPRVRGRAPSLQVCGVVGIPRSSFLQFCPQAVGSGYFSSPFQAPGSPFVQRLVHL